MIKNPTPDELEKSVMKKLEGVKDSKDRRIILAEHFVNLSKYFLECCGFTWEELERMTAKEIHKEMSGLTQEKIDEKMAKTV